MTTLKRKKIRFSFAVIGDNISNVSLVQPEPFRQNIRTINLLKPDFVVFLGDFVKGNAHDLLLDEAWDEFERVTRTLKMPYYLVIGNHDVQCKEGIKIFRNRYGPPYYSFDYEGCHFIILNSDDQEDGKNCIIGRQLEWLKQDLEAHSKAKDIFVFIHKPLWESYPKQWNADVHPLFVKHKVDFVFAGHMHLYKEPIMRDGIKYVITGGGGSPLSTDKDKGGFYHWIYITVREEEVQLAIIKPEGVLSEEGVSPPDWDELAWTQRRSFGPALIEASKKVPFTEEIKISVRNPFRFPVYGDIKWSLFDGWKITPKSREYFIEPHTNIDLFFKVEADRRAKLTYPFPWYESMFRRKRGKEPIATGKSGVRLVRRFVCRKTERKIIIDGSLNDWKDFEPLRLNRKEQVVGPWKGIDDLSAKIFLSWDKDYLYFAAEVRDDIFCQEYSGTDLWQGDSVQIALDTLNDDSSELNEGDYEFLFALTPKGKEVFKHTGKENSILGEKAKDIPFHINIHSEEGIYIYEAAISWNQMNPLKPEKGTICGFNVVVNDNDGDGSKSYIEWTPGIRESKDTSYFGDLVFE